MPGIVELEQLLLEMNPVLTENEYVFCTVSGHTADYLHLKPLATFQEKEGLTLIITKECAIYNRLPFEKTFRRITLSVHSSLNAVGLTAAVATRLASRDISANVVAAYYHDHIFVPTDKAEEAISALREISLSAEKKPQQS